MHNSSIKPVRFQEIVKNKLHQRCVTLVILEGSMKAATCVLMYKAWQNNSATTSDANSIEQSLSWKANRSLASKKFHAFLWDLNVFLLYSEALPSTYASPVPDDCDQASPSCLFMIHFDIILFVPRFSKQYISYRFCNQNLGCISLCVPYSSNPFNLVTQVIFGEWNVSCCFFTLIFLQPAVTSSLFSLNIYVVTLFLNTLNLCS